MLFDAFLPPPVVELWIPISETVEKGILVVDLMGLNLGHVTDRNLFGFVGLGE